MKAKDYKSITDLLNKKYPGREIHDQLDFGDTLTRIDQDLVIEDKIVELPEDYFNKLTKGK